MSHVPPPYAAGPEQKGLYPPIPPDQQQQQQPVGPGQTAVTYYPPTGPPQQQPQQLVITQPTPVIVGDEPIRSYVAHIILSVVVFFCCYCVLGLVAFICAVVAQSRASTLPQSARSCGKASIVVSIIGIVVGIICTIIVIVLRVMA